MQLPPSNKGILQIDLVFSGILIVLSVFTSWHSYVKLVDWNSQKGVIPIGAISKQDQIYLAVVGGKCVGELHLHFSGKELDQFSADLSLRLKYRDRDGLANTRVVFTFNPIGQFLKGNVNFDFLGLTADLLADGVDPIKIRLNSNFLLQSTVQQEISGPISLYEIKPNEYVLSGDVLASFPKVDGLVDQLIPPELSFRLVKKDQTQICDGKQLDLEELSKALTSRFGILNSLLKEKK